MPFVLIFFLLFSLPSLEEGRVMPKRDQARCLPSKFQPEKWYELEAVQNEKNFTLFSEKAYARLRSAFQNGGNVEEAYWVAYEEIGGKRLHLTSGSVLRLPTQYELETEQFYEDFPWSWLLFSGFLLASSSFQGSISSPICC